MAFHKGAMASGVALPPSVTISLVTNYNQAIATFNATVNTNGYTTSVKFQYSTNGSTWTDSGTVSGITGDNQSVYYNHDGATPGLAYLSVGTFYYVRAVATNQIGSTTSSNTTFTTWSLRTYANATPGTYTVSIPGVTPTNGSPVQMTVYNIWVSGGGGGAGYAGGGAGGYRSLSFRTFSNGSNQNLTVVIGGGGGAQAAGGQSYITGTYFTTLQAGGGGGGSPAINGVGGALGTGDVSYLGGSGYVLADKNGNPDYNYAGAGGGAGWAGRGGDARMFPFYGGDGTAGGVTTYGGYTGGAGGRGYGTESPNYGVNGGYWFGYSSGGEAVNGGGQVGLVFFQYYGP